ncbi:MAG: hypothetical protein R2875_14595 [Desulfobacterales bacterium]
MELDDTATQEGEGWIMIRDNVTGLIWEIKTDDDSIHDKDNTFAWCDTNPETNGGDPGTCDDGPDTEDLISTMNENEYGSFLIGECHEMNCELSLTTTHITPQLIRTIFLIHKKRANSITGLPIQMLKETVVQRGL